MAFQIHWGEDGVQLSVPAERVSTHIRRASTRLDTAVAARIEFPLEEAAALHAELGRGINEALRLTQGRPLDIEGEE